MGFDENKSKEKGRCLITEMRFSYKCECNFKPNLPTPKYIFTNDNYQRLSYDNTVLVLQNQLSKLDLPFPLYMYIYIHTYIYHRNYLNLSMSIIEKNIHFPIAIVNF